MLSKKAIEEYKRIHKKVHGTDISDAEANHKGLLLLELVKAIYQPLPKNQQIPIFRKT